MSAQPFPRFEDFTTDELREWLEDHERSRFYRDGVSHAMTHAHHLRAEISRREAAPAMVPQVCQQQAYAAPALATTYQIAAKDSSGTHLMETPVGETLAKCAIHLAEGQIGGMTLVSVKRLDFAAGFITDVTAQVLQEAARHCEADLRSLPENLLDACAEYGVAPVVISEAA